ncbi:hypothetical protein Trydic_g7008 [Trypoxylus dichotomus]
MRAIRVAQISPAAADRPFFYLPKRALRRHRLHRPVFLGSPVKITYRSGSRMQNGPPTMYCLALRVYCHRESGAKKGYHQIIKSCADKELALKCMVLL